MKYFTYILLILSGILTSVTAFSYGIDRELARRDFEKSLQVQDFEKPIVGCIFETNCKYYTNKLFDYEG